MVELILVEIETERCARSIVDIHKQVLGPRL